MVQKKAVDDWKDVRESLDLLQTHFRAHFDRLGKDLVLERKRMDKAFAGLTKTLGEAVSAVAQTAKDEQIRTDLSKVATTLQKKFVTRPRAAQPRRHHTTPRAKTPVR